MTGTSATHASGDPAAPIVLFDLDGTITDSAPGVVASFTAALQRCGIEMPDGDIRSRIVGPPMAVTMGSLGLPDDVASAVLAEYHRDYTATGWRDTAVFDGMADVLADLAGRTDTAGRPLRLAITTSKQQTMARRILDEFGLARHFEVIAGAEGAREDKADVIAHALELLGAPHRHAARTDAAPAGGPGRSETDVGPMLLVGDRSHDVAGAAAHSIPVAFVRWGYGDDDEARGAAWVVDTPEQLLDTIVKYTGRTGHAANGADAADGRVHITFVCTGNICRSPMAEKILTEHLRRAGLDDAVRVTSAGVGDWHIGDPADPRAQDELRAHGYPTEHAATQVGAAHLDADLIVALDSGHRRALLDAGADPERVRMLRGFDPACTGSAGADAHGDDPTGTGLDVADPYFGGRDGFTTVREQIEAAADGLVTWARAAARNRDDRR